MTTLSGYIRQSFDFLRLNFFSILGIFTFYVAIFLACSLLYGQAKQWWYLHDTFLTIIFSLTKVSVTALAISSFVQLYEDIRVGDKKLIFNYLLRAPLYFFPMLFFIILFKLVQLPLVFWKSWILEVVLLVVIARFSFSVFDVAFSRKGVKSAIYTSWTRTGRYIIPLTISIFVTAFVATLSAFFLKESYADFSLAAAGGRSMSIDSTFFFVMNLITDLSSFFFVLGSVFIYRLYCASWTLANK